MALGTESNAGPAELVGDYDAICRVVQLCTDGESKGDVAKLGNRLNRSNPSACLRRTRSRIADEEQRSSVRRAPTS
jgi:hypothetical protein